jgi:twitching motility protein PilT
MIEELLRLMVEKKASDLHLKVGSPPIIRIDGRLIPLEDFERISLESISTAFEEITSERQREILHNERELDLAHSVPGLARFRVNAHWQRGSIALAFRLVPLEILSIEQLGLPSICKDLVMLPRGLILVTGPTGSGKSTTLAAMIDHLNENDRRHIITIEDPIEFLHRDKKCVVAQRELGGDTLSYSAALRHVLRQDPDVILVGEMRDLETTTAAITAAETGHLVLATLHTTSASQTVERIIDIYPEGQQQQIRAQLALTIEGVICQQLLPLASGSGRVAALEIMVATPAVRNLIREGKTHQIPSMLQMGSQHGMRTLDQHLRDLIRQGAITREEAMMRADDQQNLDRLLKSA